MLLRLVLFTLFLLPSGLKAQSNIEWANLQWPPNGAIHESGTYDIYAQVRIPGVTGTNSAPAGLQAWVGISTNSNFPPHLWPEMVWHEASFNTSYEDRDEFMITASDLEPGTYYYASRFRYANGDYVYGAFRHDGQGFWEPSPNRAMLGVLIVTEDDNEILVVHSDNPNPVQSQHSYQDQTVDITVLGTHSFWGEQWGYGVDAYYLYAIPPGYPGHGNEPFATNFNSGFIINGSFITPNSAGYNKYHYYNYTINRNLVNSTGGFLNFVIHDFFEGTPAYGDNSGWLYVIIENSPSEIGPPVVEDYRIRLKIEQIGGNVPIEKAVVYWSHQNQIRPSLEINFEDNIAAIPKGSFNSHGFLVELSKVHIVELRSPSGELIGKIHTDILFDDRLTSSFKLDLILFLHHDIPNGWDSQSGWQYFSSINEVPVSMLVPPNGLLSSVNSNKNPLLFVHGIYGKYPYWDGEMSSNDWQQLSDAGFDSWQFYYPYDMSIPKIGSLLEEALNVLTNASALGYIPDYGVSALPVVAHSMGGLVSRSYIQSNDNPRVNKLLMLGTPNHGSLGAWQFRNTNAGRFFDSISYRDNKAPAVQQMIPGSRFLTDLNSQPPKVLNNNIQSSYIVMAGTRRTISSATTREIAGQSDNIVSVSSATLRNYHIPLITLHKNHTQIRNPGVENLLVALTDNGEYSNINGFWFNDGLSWFQNIANNSDGMLIMKIPGLSEYISDIGFEEDANDSFRVSFQPRVRQFLIEYSEYSEGGQYFYKRRELNWNQIFARHDLGFSSEHNISTLEFGRYDCFGVLTCIPNWVSIKSFDLLQQDYSFEPLMTNNWVFPLAGPKILLLRDQAESDIVDVFAKNLSNAPDQPQTSWFIDAAVDSVAFYMSVSPDLPETNTYDISLETPSGTILTPEDADNNEDLIFVENTTNGFAYYFVRNPEPGVWGLYHNQPVEEVYVSAPIGTNVNFRIDRPNINHYAGQSFNFNFTTFVDPEFSYELNGSVFYRQEGEAETFVQNLDIVQGNESEHYVTSFLPENTGTYRFEIKMEVSGEELNISRIQQFEINAATLYTLETPQILFPADGSDNITNVVNLGWSEVNDAESYALELYKTSGSSTEAQHEPGDWEIVLNGIVDETEIEIDNIELNAHYAWRIRSLAEDAISDWSEFYYYSTVSDGFIFIADAGWNLFSLPVDAVNKNPQEVFTNAIPGSIFGYDLSYYAPEELEAGKGYWVRYDQNRVHELAGNYISEVSINLKKGWNLISTGSFPIEFNQINDPSNLLADGLMYGFQNGYRFENLLYPGYGYWVKSIDEGEITLTNEDSNVNRITPTVVEKDLLSHTRIQFISGTTRMPVLYFAGDEFEAERIERYLMPPIPPRGSPDVRFQGELRLNSDFSGSIAVQQGAEALEMMLNSDLQRSYEITEFSGFEILDSYMLQDGESHVLSEHTDRIGISIADDRAVVELPVNFALEQNYPNPFNPLTQIRYALPEDSRVRLDVYNVLGQRVATLVNSDQSAGKYTVSFDASRLASGVYFYRLQAGDFKQSKKMTLIK